MSLATSRIGLHMSPQKATIRMRATGMKKAAARVGIAAFMFFFIKGLLWLTVPVLLLARACDAAPEGAVP